MVDTIQITNAASFLAVYKGNPPDEYPKEWVFFAVNKGENISFLSSYSWHLYTSTDQTATPKEDRANMSFRELGRKGGIISKIKQPILQALINFFKENPNQAKRTTEEIHKSFVRKACDKGIRVLLNNEEYVIDCDEDQKKIHYAPLKKPITYNTFKKTYIPRAKKEFHA